MVEGPPPTAPERPKGRLPRITRYMALAIYYEDLIDQGHVQDYAEIATLGHVTRARVTQIMDLRLLAPDIQEELLKLSRITNGKDAITLRSLQSITLQQEWGYQRTRFRRIHPDFMPRVDKKDPIPRQKTPATRSVRIAGD
jgi:hypothetical protein